MYQILCDNQLLYDLRDESLTATEPVLTQEINSAGSLTLTLMPDHPLYDGYTKLKSDITVLQDGVELWSGRVLSDKIDFFKRKHLTCEGELSYLNDSIQRPAELHNLTVRQFLEMMINSHNSQVDASCRFTVGAVTVKDSNDSLYRYLNYETTYKAIKDKLVDKLGGYLYIRKVDGVRYLDYLEDYPGRVNQVIEFGENLLDFTRNFDATSVATAIIPLGAKLEESQYTSIEEHLTIASVNDGLDYVQDDEAVAAYGRITAVQNWEDVTTPEALKAKGIEYLSSGQWENMTIECSAIDLNLTDKDIQSLKVGYLARIVSVPHGLDTVFPVAKKTTNLEAPQNDKVTFSNTAVHTLSSISLGANSATNQRIDTAFGDVLDSAKANASYLIDTSLHGTVMLNDGDGDGSPDEILILDTDSIDTALKVWRWNSNGLGYSSTGYHGTYGLAMTMDGAIVADFITSGSFTAGMITGGILQSANGLTRFDLDNNAITIQATDGSKAVLEGGKIVFYGANGVQRLVLTGGNLIMDNSSMIRTSAIIGRGLTLDQDPDKDGAKAFTLQTDTTGATWVSMNGVGFQLAWVYDSTLGKYVLGQA